MKQNKIILVAESDDSVFTLISDALVRTSRVYPVVRMKTSRELADLLTVGQGAAGVVTDATYILIVDEAFLESEGREFIPWMSRSDLRTRMLVLVLVAREDDRTVNRFQAMGASVCILKSQAQEVLSETVGKLGSFLAVVQGPQG
jgi:DNA-binding NarL/FixJ family response regulator